jgi:hypothetical protein
MVPIRRESESRLDVFVREFWEISDDLRDGHTGRKVTKDVVNRDTHATDTGFATPLARLDRDALPILIHVGV